MNSIEIPINWDRLNGFQTFRSDDEIVVQQTHLSG